MQCPSCGYENQEDAQYCNLCQYSFYKSQQQSVPPDKLSADIENQLNPADILAEKLNWFQRHLNLTWIIANIAVVPVFIILGNILLFITGNPPALLITDDGVDYPFYITILPYLLGFVSTFIVGGWVLVRKARSLGWLLVLFTGIGFIIFLCLRNKSNEITDMPEPASAMSPYPAEPSRSQPNPTQ